jgi:hypothetical protein
MSDKRKPRPEGGGADPAQYERFKEAARELGCEDSPERMDEVVRRAGKLPPPRKTAPQPEKARKPKS